MISDKVDPAPGTQQHSGRSGETARRFCAILVPSFTSIVEDLLQHQLHVAV
jgi:hypothetical protein